MHIILYQIIYRFLKLIYNLMFQGKVEKMKTQRQNLLQELREEVTLRLGIIFIIHPIFIQQ